MGLWTVIGRMSFEGYYSISLPNALSCSPCLKNPSDYI